MSKLLINVLFTLLISLALNSVLVESKVVAGRLSNQDKVWHFLARFCFMPRDGVIRLNLSYPKQYGVQSLLFYFDSPGQWESVYKNTTIDALFTKKQGCLERKGALARFDSSADDQIWELDEYNSYCRLNKNGTWVSCQMALTIDTSRPRWWYIVLENCQSTQGLYLDYVITMTNGEDGDIFHKHFSADEMYILQVDMTFLFIEAFLLFLSIYFADILVSKQMFHTTYKLFMTCLALEVMHLLIMCCTYGVYANTGIENRTAKYIGRAFESVGIMIFLLMLILMAKGFTITRGRISTGGVIKITVFMTCYVIIYIVIFVYEAFFFDPGFVLYTYESVPGYGLIGMRIVGWIWFMYAIIITLIHYPEKKLFYIPLVIIYTLWFWAGPIVILVGMKVIPAWFREKTVNGVEKSVTFVGNLVFLLMTTPCWANKVFPFHVRTTQIAVVVNNTEGEEMDMSTTGPYGVNNSNFTDIFVVSGESSKPKPKPIDIDRFPHATTNGIQ